MKKYSIIFLLVLNSALVLGQREYGAVTNIGLATIAQENQGNSYITAPTDIGNIEPLWFEAKVVPNFNIRTSKDSRLLGVLTPQIIIRMYQLESNPVKTPSYMPQLTVYYLLNKKGVANTFNLFGRFAHHSNGQDGAFYLDNGDINLESASFSTNYLEFGIVKTSFSERFNAVKFFSTSLEVHPPDLTIDELHGIYGMYKWNTILSIFKLRNDSNEKDKKASLSLKGKFSYTMGDFNNENTFALGRISASLTAYYHPKFLEDIGFFVQLYQGPDYYNIYFDHQLTVIRFGIMTETLRF